MTKIKRLICACLTVVLLVSALPMHAFAQDVDTPPSAVQTAENGQDEVAGDPVVETVDPPADEPAASIDTTGPPEATATPDTDTESDSAEPTKEPSAETPEVSAPVPSPTPDETSAHEQLEPTAAPTVAPTPEPSASPTAAPTPEPTATPTAEPTEEPTATPTAESTPEPTVTPTAVPTSEPTSVPEVPSVPDPFVPNSTILEDADLGMKHAWPVPGNFTLTQKYSANHRAWDIAAAEGSPVAATDQGKIIVTQLWDGIVTHGDNNSYGNMVEIRHPNGSVTLYAHLSEINVSVGDTVVAGQQIGRVGQTGNATGPHLHFEIITENGKVDPAESGYFDYETMSIARYDPQDVYDAFMGSDGKPKGTKTLSDFGVTREKVVELLSSHDSKSDNFFLGTAYNPSDYYGYSGTDWQSPNGDTSYNGYAGMNCAGFASYVLRHAGLKVQQVLSIMKANPHANYALPGNYDPDYNLLAGANNWYNFAVDAGLVGYVFCDRKAGDGVDDAKQQLLESGLAEKGDVVIMIWSDQPLSDGADNHIGFFWGDDPSEDKFWHSSHTDSSVTLYKGVRYGNQISQIQAKSEGATYVLLKYAESKFDIHLTKTSADVSLTKGNSNYTLKGAEYGVYASKSNARNGQKEIASFKTDSEGKATLSEKVANGTYYVKEKKAPKGYVLDETIYTVKVSGADAEVKVQDDPSRVQIVIKKRDAESGAVPQGDATLAGAVFRISYQQGGKTVVQEVTTNSDGVARLGKIPLGDITVQEITAPKGYVLDSTPHNYTLNTSDGVTVEQELVAEIQDGVVKGRVKIIKKAEQTDGSTTPEPGAVFEVCLRSAGSYANAKDTERDLLTTDAAGAAISRELPYGDYIVHQRSGGSSLELVDDFTVCVSDSGEPYEYELTNKRKDTQLKIVKTSDDGIVAGIKFRVTRLSDNRSFVYTTDADGTIMTEAFPIYEDDDGTRLLQYRVEEIEVPERYVLPPAQTVTLRYEEIGTVHFHNNEKRFNIAVTKTDADTGTVSQGSAVFAGAVYGVYKDGELLDVYTVGQDGTFLTKEYICGDGYTLREITPPKGYTLSDAVIPIDASAEHFSMALSQIHVDVSDSVIRGGLLIEKRDVETGLLTPQGNAVLDGTKFAVKNLNLYPVVVDGKSYKQGAVVLTITAQDGIAQTAPNALPYGHYSWQEVQTGDGYLLTDGTVREFNITSDGQIAKFSENDGAHNQVIRGGVLIEKRDAETGLLTPQGAASLDGTQFEIRNLSEHPVIVSGNSYKKNEVVLTVTVKNGIAQTAADALPYGHYSWQEVKVGTGYLLTDGEAREFDIRDDGKLVEYREDNAAHNQVIRGGVLIEKRDAETGLLTPQGAASLDGTQFEIRNLSDYPVIVNGNSYKKDEVILTVTVKNGIAQTAADALPYGHYSWQEVKVGSGYLLTDGEAREFDIREDGKLVEYREDNAAHNQVIRGDIDFIKAAEDDMHRLVHVPFRLTSETTGESHILVTDANGYVSTEASWNPHTVRTNINDTVPDGGTADLLAGVWFGADAEPDDSVGALPYDTYTLEELRCEANAEYDLITVKGITVSRNTRTVHLGTIDDRYVPQPEIWTAAHGKDGGKTLFEDEHAILVDVLTYTNLPKRELVVRGVVMDKATGKPILQDGEQVTAEKRITPRLSEGSVEMEYTLDTTGLGGHDLVVFEYVYEADGSTLVAEHADLEDEDQTLTVIPPEIGTTAYVGASTDKTTFAVEEVTVRDIVHYKNLVPGKTVRVEGVLMNKETGNPFLVQGKEVTSTVHFTPDDSEGDVEVPFVFNVPVITQTLELVVFEEMYREHSDTALAVHADIADKEQTVTLIPPEIRTQASDGADGDKTVFEDSSATLIDTVHFKHLPEQAFVLRGILMDKNTGRQLVQDDKPVTAELRFTPESPDGTVEMQYSVDTTGLGGHDLVVFEYLYTAEGEEPVAEHADLEDENQTLTVLPPEIGTTAYVGDSDEQVAAVTQTVVIRDVVHYSNLVPGKTVRVEGTLMDKETGNPFLVHGEKVTSTVHFAPDSSEGEIEITFEFDGVEIAKKHTRLVVFESVYWEDSDTALAVHADIADKEQTVELLPIRGNVQVRKTNAHDPNQLLSGAVFAVYDDRNGDGLYNPEVDVPVDMLTESEPGVYGLSDLLYGSYLIHEEQGIEGFVRDDTYYPFMITVNGETVLVETETGKGFANKPIFGTVRVEKVNADTLERLSGAEFAVYKDRDGDGKYNPGEDVLYGTLEESDKGIYTLDQLPYGAYLLHEEVAPDGFQRDDQYYAFSIQDDGQTVIVENTPGKGFTNQPVPTPEIPQTGDNTNLGFWLSLGAVALGGLIGTLFLIYKRKDDD